MGEWKRRDGSPLSHDQRLNNGEGTGNRTGVVIEEFAPLISENQEHGTVYGN